MSKIVLYSHSGSYNHGCEALVRSTRKILDTLSGNTNFYLATLKKEEDNNLNITGFKEIVEYSNYVKKGSISHIYSAIVNRFSGRNEQYIKLAQKDLYRLFDDNTIALSIGGDNYCYTDSKWLHLSHSEAKRRLAKTVLWGCSLEEKKINNEMLDDLKKYNLIIARESITYNLLVQMGLGKSTKLYPDPAFQLEYEEVELPENFQEYNTVGINLSPYIFNSRLEKPKVIQMYINLIKHILDTTSMQIALIPHVFWDHNHDLGVLREIYNKFKATDRVILIEDNYNCMKLKYIISKCRLFVGARTHSTIAAYSSCIPTLVLGYSVKSKGIARDIFGSEENMVISVQDLEEEINLINAFEYIKNNEKDIRTHLEEFIPIYKEKALLASDEIKRLINLKTS